MCLLVSLSVRRTGPVYQGRGSVCLFVFQVQRCVPGVGELSAGMSGRGVYVSVTG